MFCAFYMSQWAGSQNLLQSVARLLIRSLLPWMLVTAVVKALKHWRHHLAGAKHPFTVVTDHANLAYWKESRDLNRRMARWHSFLQEYWFNIQITPGKNHSAADFLSRHPHNNKGILDNTQIIVFPPDRFVDTNYEIADHHKGKVPLPRESTLRVADMDREFDDWDSDIAWTQRQYRKLLEEWRSKYLIIPPTPGAKIDQRTT